jgi:hypothetical protein
MNTIRNIVGVEPKETRHSFFELSLCLSRACLGKMMHFILKRAQKWRFFTSHSNRLQKTPWRFNQRFPCLSRACLGKYAIV